MHKNSKSYFSLFQCQLILWSRRDRKALVLFIFNLHLQVLSFYSFFCFDFLCTFFIHTFQPARNVQENTKKWQGTPYPSLKVTNLDIRFFNDKGQLDSEWIYEVIVSSKIATKNYRDFCTGSLLEGRAKISVIFGWDFRRNNDFINSFWI